MPDVLPAGDVPLLARDLARACRRERGVGDRHVFVGHLRDRLCLAKIQHVRFAMTRRRQSRTNALLSVTLRLSMAHSLDPLDGREAPEIRTGPTKGPSR